jgi:hypothetical protein
MVFDVKDIIKKKEINKSRPKVKVQLMNKEDTLIILDWDDTLFPTSWVMENNINLNNIEVRNRYHDMFSSLNTLLYNFLRKCMMNGRIIIVTNAMPGWVKISASVMPSVNAIIDKIPVVSARKDNQHVTKNIMDWKKLSFKKEYINFMQNKTILNIISIGDAEYEYKALVDLYKLNPNRKKILKSVKLIKSPDYETLLDQLDVLSQSIYSISKVNRHLDLNFDFHNNKL